MSRNFELLRRAEKEHELLGVPAPAPAPVPVAVTPKVSAGASRREVSEEAQVEMLIREEELKLVQRLFLLPNSNSPSAVVFSGVDQTQGCAWICSRTGETLAAHVEGSVCLVDANQRSPYLHQYFGANGGYGFAEALLEPGPIRKFAQQLSTSNLWLVPCGSALDRQSLLKPDRLPARLADLRADFDYVLVNTPPLNLYADAIAIGQLADGLVMVVEANSTRREVAQQAKAALAAANVKLLGAVLNNRTFPIPESIYRKL